MMIGVNIEVDQIQGLLVGGTWIRPEEGTIVEETSVGIGSLPGVPGLSFRLIGGSWCFIPAGAIQGVTATAPTLKAALKERNTA